MCGRFTRYLPWSEIQRLYRLTTDWERQRNDAPRYNIAPTDPVPFVTQGENGAHKLREGRWWLVPWWAKEMPKQAMFQCADRDGRNVERLQGCFSVDAMPNTRGWLLRVDEEPGRRRQGPLAHLPARSRAVFFCRPMGAQQGARYHQLHDHNGAGRTAGQPAP